MHKNMMNLKISKLNTSGFKGVTLCRRSGKWIAKIKDNKTLVFLGRFDSPQKAHDAYCEAALKYHGKFANSGEAS